MWCTNSYAQDSPAVQTFLSRPIPAAMPLLSARILPAGVTDWTLFKKPTCQRNIFTLRGNAFFRVRGNRTCSDQHPPTFSEWCRNTVHLTVSVNDQHYCRRTQRRARNAYSGANGSYLCRAEQRMVFVILMPVSTSTVHCPPRATRNVPSEGPTGFVAGAAV